MAKIPENTNINDNKLTIQRMVQVATVVIIINKRINTTVTLEIRPNTGNFNVNVALVHRNILSSIKIKDPRLKITTSQNEIIDTPLQFLGVKTTTQRFSTKSLIAQKHRESTYCKILNRHDP